MTCPPCVCGPVFSEFPCPCRYRVRIRVSLVLLARTETTLSHVYRLSNQGTKHQARPGAAQAEDLVVTLPSMRPFIVADAWVLGISKIEL